MIPLFIGLTGRTVIIFGGGEVAVRKSEYFFGEAEVRVFSRSHSEAMLQLPVIRTVLNLQDITDEALEEIISEAFIVIAATSDRIQNNRIGEICGKRGILFNNADGEAGDLIIPSVSSGKRYTIAISTRGKSPATSRFIREFLDKTFIQLDEMIELQEMLRHELRKTEPSREKRSIILRDIVRDPEVWSALSRSPQEAEDLARRRYLHG